MKKPKPKPNKVVCLPDRWLTEQELFDNAALGIIGQGGVAAFDLKRGCVTMTTEGARCALGWSVNDAKPDATTTPEWRTISSLPLGVELRRAHDVILAAYNNKPEAFGQWQELMSMIALGFGLDDSAVYFKLVT